MGSAAPRPARGKGRWGTAGGEGGGTRVELSPGALPLGWRPSLTLARAGPRRGHGLPPCVLMPAPQPRRVCGSAAGPSRCPGAHLDEIPNSPPEVLGAGHPATCAPGAQEMSLLSLFSERIPSPSGPIPPGAHTPSGPSRGAATGRPSGHRGLSGEGVWTEVGRTLEQSFCRLGPRRSEGTRQVYAVAGAVPRPPSDSTPRAQGTHLPPQPPPAESCRPEPWVLCCAPRRTEHGFRRRGLGDSVPHSRGLWVALSGLPEVSRRGGRLWNDGQLGWNLANFPWPQCWSEEQRVHEGRNKRRRERTSNKSRQTSLVTGAEVVWSNEHRPGEVKLVISLF